MSDIDREKIAKEFVAEMREQGFNLNFTIGLELYNELDNLVDSPAYNMAGSKDPVKWRNEAKLSAYLGELLKASYGGEWAGEFSLENTATNYYTSHVQFSDCKIFPSHIIAHRASNGREDAPFAELFEEIISKIESK